MPKPAFTVGFDFAPVQLSGYGAGGFKTFSFQHQQDGF